MKLEELLLPVPEETVILKMLDKIKEVCSDSRSSLCDEEFAQIAAKVGANEGIKIHR